MSTSTEASEAPKKSKSKVCIWISKIKLGTWGVVATVVYAVALCSFLFLGQFEKIKSYNELGDTLAGIFSPVAFFWLVLGFFQQQTELQQNTKALQMQATELQQSVEQYKKMVEIAQNQLDSELTTAQLEKTMRENETKPTIKLKSLRWQANNTLTYTFRPEVYSDGRDAKDVLIEFVGGFGNYTSFKFDNLNKGVYLPENTISRGDLPDEVVVLISYTSSIGIMYKYQYRYYNLLSGVYQNVKPEELKI
ncbi:hypothetical protein [Pantoea ananatis]|uniref:hypothetical protein n=1 Tax=Pantoea ananas TaxID=553 RepID=UPI001B3022B7|nr:hypothetical protein [Pantoea ananatis]